MDSQQNIPTSISQTNIEITVPPQPKPSVKEAPSSLAKFSLNELRRLSLTKLGFILCTWIFVFAVLGLLIALMVFHFSHKDYSLSSLAGGLNYLALNLNTDPILQITVANPSGTCPENFEPFLIGKWPGINAGCNCPGDILRSGSCDSVVDLVCENIDFIPEIDLFKWDGPGWCIHRAKQDSEYVKKGDCPVNFKECSVSICVREDLECPITSVSLTPTPMYDGNFKYGSNYLNIFRDKDVSPLINFDITENDIPCFSLNQSPAGTAPYTLIRDYPQGCETYGPDNFFSFSIAHMTQEQVLRANNFSQKIFDLPNYMSTLQSTTSVLSGRKRVAISGRDDICANLELGLVSNSGDAADHMNITITVCSILALIFHIVLCLVILQKSCGKGLKAFYKSENLENWLGFFVVFAFLESVILVVMTILVLCFHSTMISTKNYFTSLQHSSCFMTGQPQDLVSDYNNVVDEVGSVLFKYSIALLILSVGPFASVILSQTLKRSAK